MFTILLLLLFIFLAISFWIIGIFFAINILIFVFKWGLIALGVYLLIKEIGKLLR